VRDVKGGREAMAIRRAFTASWLLVALSIGLRYGTAATYLDVAEMQSSRGGGGQANKCSQTCNASNGYINLCPTGVGVCTACSLGSTQTNYLDQDPNCGPPGQVTSPTRNTNCGLVNLGNCTGIGVCTPGINSRTPCNQPPVVCPQGNCL
jgi:hypothetical protein